MIRESFYLECAIIWTQDVEPKAKAAGVEGEKLAAMRQAFNQHMEKRDLEWWRKRVTETYSMADLRSELEETIERTKAIGIQAMERERKQNLGMGW